MGVTGFIGGEEVVLGVLFVVAHTDWSVVDL
jgi:hypothetical protein